VSGKIKVAGVVGTRPNFMKIGPLAAEMEKHAEDFEFVLVHTGQHYDPLMNDIFFSQLGIRKPDIHLGVGSAGHAEQTAKVMLGFEKAALELEPHLVVVVGDVNSTLAAALVAAKLGITLAHVEAGLRSRDRRMPEEINRTVTDTLSDLLFTPTRMADENLLAEGVEQSKICLVGNIMIDTLIRFLGLARDRPAARSLGLEPGGYCLATLHRPANVDDPDVLSGIVAAFLQIAQELPLVFPAHPRTVKTLKTAGLYNRLESEPGIRLIEPLGYLDFVALMKSAKFVMTDSGGIQEETTYLRIPCLTLRENTERPETISRGTNLLVGRDRDKIVAEALHIAAGGGKIGGELEFWDGKVASRIVAELKKRKEMIMAPAEVRLAPGARRQNELSERGEKNV